MKKTLLTLAVGVVPLLTQGQGQISFSNIGGPVNAPVTNAETGVALATGWRAQLWAGASDSDLQPFSQPVEFIGEGYFSGGILTLDFLPPGESPYFQIAAWENPANSLFEAQDSGLAWGLSNIFSTPTSPTPPAGSPPTPPKPLEGLEPFTVQSSAAGIIGDLVWSDLNRNGLQEDGEPGLGQVEIKVLDCATSEVIDVVFSDDQGYWALKGDLPAESYLEVVIPEGYTPTAWGVGTDDTVDSDIDPLTGRSQCIVTECGGEDTLCISTNIDIGLVPNPTLPPLPNVPPVNPNQTPPETSQPEPQPETPEEPTDSTSEPEQPGVESPASSRIASVAGPGFWKRQAGAWPVDEVVIGGQRMTKEDAIPLISNGSDKSLTLFRQVISAKLNIARGADSSCIEEILMEADAWLTTHGPVPGNIAANSPAWQEGAPLAEALDRFNNGEACAPSEHTSLNPVELAVGYNGQGNRPTDEDFRLRVSGEPGRTYIIQKTTDFMGWDDVIVIENSFGISEALAENQAANPNAFFRVIPERGPAKKSKPRKNRVGTFMEVKANQTIELEPIVYEGDLIIAGAKNSISGTTLDNNRYTVIAGNLEIRGANNTVSNLTVLGDVTLRGNKNELHNVDYQGEVFLEGGPQNNIF